MKPLEEQNRQPSLSEELTVIFLRGNGSPRTFRLSLPALQRSLTALGFFFAFAIAAALFLLLLHFVRFAPDRIDSAGSPAVNLTPAEPGKDDSSLQQEVNALREDVARLNATANDRKNLAAGANPLPLQFFGPRNTVAEGSPIQVKNLKVTRTPTKNVYVDFEIHNVDPEQKLARGYILVLAKTPSALFTYPDGAFSPTQNIVLDFTKGETFGVSRFRQARAVFPAAPLEGKAARFQVMLFTNDGKVIADLHVEDIQ